MGKPVYGQKDGKRKVSFLYRQKAKLKKGENSEDTITNVNKNDKESRIIVRNLPFKITEEDVRKLYAPFGKIKEVNLLKRSDGNLVGCGFVQFNHVEDASKAIFNTNKKEFLGRIISSDWAVPKSKFCEKRENSQEDAKAEGLSSEDTWKADNAESIQEKKITKEKDKLKMQKKKKLLKKKRQKKRARIVIRNLSFKITEDNLKEYFSQYGEIDEINLLRKSEGQMTGVAFLQFKYVQAAAKAIHYSNMQPLLNRSMIVDWAVPKSKFPQNSTSDVKPEIKEENETHNSLEIQVSHSDSDVEIESENLQTPESTIAKNRYSISKIKQEAEESENDTNNDDIDDEDSDDDDDKDDVKVAIDEAVVKQEIKEEENSNAKRRILNDVSEGRTIFLKQVPFSVKNEELKTYMEQFGTVYYALICIDPLTEYSRGTAFVKFRHVEDAEKCLSAKELRLHDQRMEAHRALHRNDVENKKKLKETRVRDSRNLYLVKEGVVVAKSTAAIGVSMSDMEKRLKLEKWKSQMLRNLSMFVSKVRLVVHNLPPSFTDDHLRQLFKNYSDSNARITEARVMRDLKNLDSSGNPKSKEYGFVTFTRHEDALKALRNINNNPNIFSKNRRPVVGFSIENRTILKAKEKRIQKSRENNPLWSGNKRKTESTEKEVPAKRIKHRDSNNLKEKLYAGITGKLGHDNLRSNFKLKSQAELHNRTSKKQKKLNKATKQLKMMKKEKMKKKQDNVTVKQPRKIDTEDANFNKLVDNYRNNVKRITLKKSKWYESSNKS